MGELLGPNWIAMTPDAREVIRLEVMRLKAEYKFEGEIVYLETMAKIMGLDVRSVWNLRSRGRMPPIREVDLFGKKGYFATHVALWLLDMPFGGGNSMGAHMPTIQPKSPSKQCLTSAYAEDVGAPMKTGARTSLDKGKSHAKKLLLERANQLFEESERKRMSK